LGKRYEVGVNALGCVDEAKGLEGCLAD
jgi:hypothetical protein